MRSARFGYGTEKPGRLKAVVLAGGLGTRLAEETDLRPKPMVEIGGRPILWHILKIYSHYGIGDFVLALGYKGEIIKRFFLDFAHLSGSMTIDVRNASIDRIDEHPEDWTVSLIDTGMSTMTGGRLRRVRDFLNEGTFCMTYGDGVADVDIKSLLDFHRSHGRLATLTAVRPPARYGAMHLDEARVTEFMEKPQIGEGYINGGFFALEPGVLDYIDGDETHWEREPLERLARDGELMAYRHDGFWLGMDTIRDKQYLQRLWDEGQAPWKVWA